ncbi:MAG: hypothetical protein U0167_04515 [bacterium]
MTDESSARRRERIGAVLVVVRLETDAALTVFDRRETGDPCHGPGTTTAPPRGETRT